MAHGRARRSGQRRVTVPGIAELLRPATPLPLRADDRLVSGRESHSHKITVYLTEAELVALERARVTLRVYGIPAVRGRVVREALAVLLADLDAEGGDSLIARRLRDGQ